MRLLPIIALFLSTGCYASHEPGSPAEPIEDRVFADDWEVVSAHGFALLATVTVYRFHADGEIEILSHEEGTYFEGVIG